MAGSEPTVDPARGHCWRGRGDTTPFVPGVPDEVPRYSSLRVLLDDMLCCTRCDLARERTQVVRGVGPTRAALMLIGEAPGAEEDRRGAPFVGRSGRLLDRLLESNGIERGDVYITNVVACRPPGNRSPRVREIRAHAPWLEQQLRLVGPRLVATLGRVALTYFIPKARITKLRGVVQSIDRGGRRIPLLPLYHPSAILRRRELLPAFEEDFARIPELLRGARA